MRSRVRPEAAIALVGSLVVCLIAVVAASQEQASPAALKSQMEQARKAGDVARAAALADQLVQAVEPDHWEALYSAAQLQATLGHREQALMLLARAVSAGFPYRARILADEAFAAYRNDDFFKSLARKAWAQGYTSLLERSNREDVQKSPEILKRLAFKPGERVAEIGPGTGYFTMQVARAVGSTGRVLALDIAPEMLEYLDMRVKAAQLTNVESRRVASDDPMIPAASVDTILMVDVIHYVKDRTAYARKLLPALAPGGRVVIIDYRPKPMSERPWGPPPEQQFPKEQLDREMGAAGFKVAASYDFLPEQFFVVYTAR